MGVKELRQEIASGETAITSQREELDLFRQKITEEAKPYIKENLRKAVEKEVKDNPEHTKELGKDTLSNMKQRLLTLLDQSDALVDEVFGDDSLWLHVSYVIKSGQSKYEQVYYNKQEAETRIKKCFKIVLGEAGRILIDNGYFKPGVQYQWDVDRWHSPTQTSSNSSRLVYKYALMLPQNIERLISEYCKEMGDLHETMDKVLNLRRKLDEQEALDLWNDA